jgi:L-histidine Nalpha-methyltransferase / hercynylcysteine S-oxide synthase
LRHKCLFYLGHIPAYVGIGILPLSSEESSCRFLDIHLSRFLNEPHTKPDNYKVIV